MEKEEGLGCYWHAQPEMRRKRPKFGCNVAWVEIDSRQRAVDQLAA